jgi:prevent-host-death family protein
MGLREANQRFSSLIRAVRKGQEVVLTDRGRAIAVVRPLPASEEIDVTLQRLEKAGLLRVGSTPRALPPFKPRPIRGAPLSATLREERDLG